MSSTRDMHELRRCAGGGLGPSWAALLVLALAACRGDPRRLAEHARVASTDRAPAAGAPSAAERDATAPSQAPPSVTLSAVGDCTLGDQSQSEFAPGSFYQTFEESGNDYARPFSGVVDLLRADDLTIANLEGTLTVLPRRDNAAFAFRGRPDFAKMLVAGSVELVNMANNHSADCGIRGIDDTRRALDEAGVSYFGLGHVDVRTIHGIEVVNLGWTGGRAEIRHDVADAVQKYKRADNLVIVTFHWGVEGSHETISVQTTLGRAAIDAGADLVLGHHPHVLQGIETYKGKKIVYSLGNFVFGGDTHPAEYASMIYRATFERREGTVLPASDEIIPVQISDDTTRNDFHPIPLAADARNAVIDLVAKLSVGAGRTKKLAALPSRGR